jgi:hypothetical protein
MKINYLFVISQGKKFTAENSASLQTRKDADCARTNRRSDGAENSSRNTNTA